GPEIERHTGPTPAVELHPERDERFGGGLRVHTRVLAVARYFGAGDPSGRVLRTHDLGLAVVHERLRGEQRIDLSIAHVFRAERNRGLNREERQELHEVVLDHVAKRTRA